jgi:hypothetical protein
MARHDAFTRTKRDTGSTTAIGVNAGNGAVIAETDTVLRADGFQGTREGGEAAINQPHPFGFDMRDQDEGGGRVEW